MKFGISITIDEKADHKSHLIISLSEALKEYFQDKNYGEDIKDYIIGCICILPPEGFEKFNKPKKPIYIDDKTTKNRFTGEELRMHKLFINEFISVSDEESKKILENKIIESLENLDKLPKKVKDFDKKRFKNDLLVFLKKETQI